MKAEAAELFSMYGEVQDDYSGRGMYGKTTHGVVFDSDKEFFKAVADLLQEFVLDQNMNDSTILAEALKSIRTDSMGMGIIYY